MSGLSSHKEGILKERDRLSAEVEELNRRLQIQRLYTDEIERKRAEVEAKNKELYKLVDVCTSFCWYIRHIHMEMISGCFGRSL